MLKEVRRLFIVGVFAAAPLGLTIYILVQLFRWFDQLFQPLVRPFFGASLPGLGLIVGIIFILLVGVLAPSLIGRQFIFLSEKLVERLPLAKMIYSGTKQIFSSFSQTNLERFHRVVMVRFPHSESFSLGFVTQELANNWIKDHPDHTLAVFVPTTPNPTSGYLLYLAERDTIPVDLSVEDALKMIISVGLVRPTSKSKSS